MFSSAFAMALFKFESNAPEQCPKCHSYKISTVYEPVVDSEQEYFSLCQACGWNNIPDPPKGGRNRKSAMRTSTKK